MHELNHDFALVLITEHYDESLIMLRRQLCWEPEDIVYMSLKVSHGWATTACCATGNCCSR